MRWASLIWDAQEACEAKGGNKERSTEEYLLGLTGSSPHSHSDLYWGYLLLVATAKLLTVGILTDRDRVSNGGK